MKRLMLAAALVVLGCNGTFIDSNGNSGAKDIGKSGGTLKGSGVTVNVPSDALDSTVHMTVTAAPDGNPSDFIGTPVELGPEGTQFSKPVEITFEFDPAQLPDPTLPELVHVAVVQNGDWVPLDGTVDVASGTVTGTTTHFSRYGLIQTCGNNRKCPQGQVCVQHRCQAVEVCNNGIDDDGDGLVDCADADCASFAACQQQCCFDTIAKSCVTSCCQNGVCMGNCYCGSGWCSYCAGGGTETNCTDGLDNDKDGFVDCKDPDCAKDPACATAAKEICNNGIDDDGDGAIDCADSDCASDPIACPSCCYVTVNNSCVPSCCANGVCQMNCYCGPQLCGKCGTTSPEICGDGIDNDRDGLVDCQDPDCQSTSACTCSSKDGGVNPGCCYPVCGPNETLSCIGANICGYPCKCVPSSTPDAGSGTLTWYTTCGDPVCQGWKNKGIRMCTSAEKAGAACTKAGDQCDPGDPCNVLLDCATSDPKTSCPVSRTRFKDEISPVEEAQMQRYHDELIKLPLASYRYKADGVNGPRHLGFLIDGNESLACVRPERDQVDLYGYTTMAVAALKVQEQEIAALKQELAALKAQRPAPCGSGSK